MPGVPILAAGACLRWTSASDESRVRTTSANSELYILELAIFEGRHLRRAYVGEDARRAHQGVA